MKAFTIAGALLDLAITKSYAAVQSEVRNELTNAKDFVEKIKYEHAVRKELAVINRQSEELRRRQAEYAVARKYFG